MKIATFNANSIRARLTILLDWLKQNQPDVLGVQETKVEDQFFPVQAIRDVGYHVVFKGEKSYNGVALLTRKEATDVRFGLDDGGPVDGPRLVSATVEGVRIVNTYVPQGREIDHLMYQYKQAWFGRMRQHFERHHTPDDRVIWIGDLNVAPTSIDVHNPQQQTNHVCYHEHVQTAYRGALAWGFEDVFRKHQPGPGHYSFFDFRTPNVVKRNMGWRIDHILATPSAYEKSRSASIDLSPRLLEKPSDHTFVTAEFDF